MNFRGITLSFILIAIFNSSVSASTIDFSTLAGNNNDPFPGFYYESDYAVRSYAGDWLVATTFGNPAPNIHCFNCQIGYLDIYHGSLFTFSSIDVGSAGPQPFSFTVQGSLNGTILFTDIGTSPLDYATINTYAWQTSAGIAVDHLDIIVYTSGNDGNIDNIVLNDPTSAPEPTTNALLASGLLGFRASRKKQS